MKSQYALRSFACLVLAAFVAGCASSPKQTEAKTSATFQAPLDKAHKAAADALAVIGCRIEKDEPNHLEGFRDRKVGLFVGSGGETIGVWLAAQGAGTTEVRVKTAKSFAGMAGQKNWDEDVMAEIRKSLGK